MAFDQSNMLSLKVPDVVTLDKHTELLSSLYEVDICAWLKYKHAWACTKNGKGVKSRLEQGQKSGKSHSMQTYISRLLQKGKLHHMLWSCHRITAVDKCIKAISKCLSHEIFEDFYPGSGFVLLLLKQIKISFIWYSIFSKHWSIRMLCSIQAKLQLLFGWTLFQPLPTWLRLIDILTTVIYKPLPRVL